MQHTLSKKNEIFKTTKELKDTLISDSSNKLTTPVLDSRYLKSQASSNMSYQNISTTVKLKGKNVKVHALCTGTVAVKTAFRTKRGAGEIAKLNILFDRHFTSYLPIWVWVIEHPAGLIVIDTGENTGVKNLDKYLANESWFMRYQFKHSAKFSIDEQQQLDHQFEQINLKPVDVNMVVLTHLHLDHTDGLKFFQGKEVIINDYEFKHPYSNLPSTYPGWFRPNRVIYKKDRIETFSDAYPITPGEDLLYVPTPGHTHGHSSVIFKTDDFDIIFAGDISYNQEQVLRNELAGVNADFRKSILTYNNVLNYAKMRKTIYLPSHDENAGLRLSGKKFIL